MVEYEEKFRIATTQAGLTSGYFVTLGIRQPDLVTTRDHSVVKAQSTGGEKQQGYEVIELFWETLLTYQAATIRTKVEAAVATAAGLLYLTVPASDARTPGRNTWLDWEGKPSMPTFNPDGKTGIYKNVVLRINNAVEV